MSRLRKQSPKESSHAQAEDNSVQSLQDYVHTAIRKYMRKVTRYEKAVIADRDPENLHQMRVGMRRLRTALKTYGSVLQFPSFRATLPTWGSRAALGNCSTEP